MNKKYEIREYSFTLVELLVVAAIVLLIIGVVSNLFFSALRGATKTTIINEVKQNGDYALSVMERMIRNAASLNSPTCPFSSSSNIVITNPDNYQTTFACPSPPNVRIASNSSYLTSDKVAVSGCSFTCFKPTSSSAMVKITFSIHQPPPSAGVTLRPEEKISINYETSVVVRNIGF